MKLGDLKMFEQGGSPYGGALVANVVIKSYTIRVRLHQPPSIPISFNSRFNSACQALGITGNAIRLERHNARLQPPLLSLSFSDLGKYPIQSILRPQF